MKYLGSIFSFHNIYWKHKSFTPDSCFRCLGCEMLHSAGVDVPLTRCKGQSWELVEGLIIIGSILTERHSLHNCEAIFSPADFDGSWVEIIRQADEAVFYTRFYLSWWEDYAFWRV